MFTWQDLLIGVIGSFVTALVCQQTGRDPRLGGIVGLITGFFLGLVPLASLWAWLYLNRLTPRKVKRPTRWYLWFL